MSKFSLIGIFLLIFLPLKVHSLEDKNFRFCERDCAMEYRLFSKYARQGSSLANLAMAIMNYKGHGREINITLANRQLIRAAREAEPAAMYQLAYNLMFGLYMEQNLDKSLVWFKRAEKFDVLNSKRITALLSKFLNGHEADLGSSVNKTFNKKVVKKSELVIHQKEDKSIEHISVSQSFYWSFILYNAQLQTCYVNCAIGSSSTMFPLIHIANEQATLTKLEKL